MACSAALMALGPGLTACRSGRELPPTALREKGPPVKVAELEVTSGSIVPLSSDRFAVRGAELRAQTTDPGAKAAELSFLYLGPTSQTVPLASGELRRQIGLKLRAQNTCNVLYVMWHIEPTSAIAVSVKSNPGQSTHAECHDHGYTTHAECHDHGYTKLAPAVTAPVRPVRVGEQRLLSAAIEGDTLRVHVDGGLVWEGRLPDAARALEGPAGIRTDNGEFEATLRVGDR
jgi:hypothetical protein